MKGDLSKQTILLTGGTGSFGKAFIAHMLSQRSFRGTIRVFSRDEFKQYELGQKYHEDKRLRFFIGDVRDLERLKRAMHEADVVIHAAALKQVPILEYNPFEAVKTNIYGSQNIIDAALDVGVKKAILISSDKAVSPTNLYGATKMVAEKIFIQANSYSGEGGTIFSVARYGNVVGSRGSVIPVFLKQKENNELTLTSEQMTRFWITLDQGVDFVLNCLFQMKGGEIFVPKLPSVKIVDLARAIAPRARIKIIGIRPGEKLHEVLISEDEARHTIEFKDHFTIEPESASWRLRIKRTGGKKLREGFVYSSLNNGSFFNVPQILKLVKEITLENGQ